MTRFQKIIFFLLIFLIPSNLFLTLSTHTAIIDGILVDYLIPKLFLTDLLILTLLLTKPTSIKLSIPYSIFLFITLLKIPFSQNPTAAAFFWLKIVEFSLFFLWLKSNIKGQWLIIRQALSASILWQSILAVSQFIYQKNIFPYWFFGESQFSAITPGIAKTSFLGFLKVLPLGTTPHPNVLAGFLAVSIFIIPFSPLTILAVFTILLTQSFSALAALVIGIFLIFIPNFQNLIPLFIINPTSFTRRQTLNQIALKILKANPLTGVGLNNFTAQMSNYGFVQGTSRFLQPVHNIYLLLLSETGIIAFFLISSMFIKHIKRFSIPLAIILFIGLIDHYPLTLQTGQLLLVISLAFNQNSSS